MTSNEVLSLEINKKSLKKLDTFLSHEPSGSIEYHKVNAYKGLMLYKLGNVKEAFVLLLNAINKSSDKRVIVLYADSLIDIYLSLEDFSKAMKYIELKSQNLSPIELDKHSFDMIKYYVKRKDKESAKREIETYLNDDISDYNKYYVYKILLDYAYDESDIKSFLIYYITLEEYYKSINDKSNLEEIYLDKIYLYYKSNMIDELNSFCESINIEYLTDKTKLIFYTYIIKGLISQNSLRRASILDSSFEPFINKNKEVYVEEAKAYYLTTLSLYKQLSNNYSINYINEILAGFSKEDLKVKEKTTKSRFKDFNQIVIENVIKEETKEDIKDFKLKNSDKETILVSGEYLKLNETINSLFNLDYNLEFRELMRQILISFSKKYKFESCYLFSKNKQGYHYKANKLYDKNKFDFDISRTINNRTIELKKEIVLHDLACSYYNISIIDGTELEYKACMSFPIFYQGEVVASITYYFMNSEIDEFFEYFKIISSIISLVYINKLIQKNYIQSKDILSLLETKINEGIKEIKDDYIILNEKARIILDINARTISINDYYSLIKLEDKSKFKDAIERLFYTDIKEYTFTYELIDKRIIKDTFIKNEDNQILSFMEDISQTNSLVNNLKDDISKSNFLNVLSYKALNLDYFNLINDKAKTLVFAASSNFDTYYNLYGFEFSEGIIEGLSQSYKRYEKKYDFITYYLDSDRFLLLFNFNDQRRINRTLPDLIKHVVDDIIKINKRVNLNLHMGAYKYKSGKTVYLKDAIDFAKEAYEDSIKQDKTYSIYSQDIYNSSFFKDYLDEIEISEAIDKDKLGGVYCPIYDINNQSIFGYMYKLTLDNLLIDESNFNSVISKRHLEYMIDKYLIEHVVKDLKTFYQKTGYYLNIFIPIHSISLENDNFIKNIANIFNFYKVQSNLISFIINGNISNSINIEKLRGYINLGSESIDNVFKYHLDSMYINMEQFSVNDAININLSLKDRRVLALNIKNINDYNDLKTSINLVSTKFNTKRMSITNLCNEALGKE